MPTHLVPTPIPSDLRQAGSDLKEGIDTGQIKGLGVVVALGGSRFFVDVFGSLMRDPHVARGFVASLDDYLQELGQRRRDGHTTI